MCKYLCIYKIIPDSSFVRNVVDGDDDDEIINDVSAWTVFFMYDSTKERQTVISSGLTSRTCNFRLHYKYIYMYIYTHKIKFKNIVENDWIWLNKSNKDYKNNNSKLRNEINTFLIQQEHDLV